MENNIHQPYLDALKEKGLTSFILISFNEADNQYTVSFQNVRSGIGVNALIQALLQSLDHELAANPNYKESYKKIFVNLKEGIVDLVKQTNARVAKFNAKKNHD